MKFCYCFFFCLFCLSVYVCTYVCMYVCVVDMGGGVPPQPESAEEEQGQAGRQAPAGQEGQLGRHREETHDVCMRGDSKIGLLYGNVCIYRKNDFIF